MRGRCAEIDHEGESVSLTYGWWECNVHHFTPTTQTSSSGCICGSRACLKPHQRRVLVYPKHFEMREILDNLEPCRRSTTLQGFGSPETRLRKRFSAYLITILGRGSAELDSERATPVQNDELALQRKPSRTSLVLGSSMQADTARHKTVDHLPNYLSQQNTTVVSRVCHVKTKEPSFRHRNTSATR